MENLMERFHLQGLGVEGIHNEYLSRQVSPFFIGHEGPQGEQRYRGIALLCFQTSVLERDEGSASRLGRFLPPGKTRYPLYRRLGGPQGRSGRQNISPHRDQIPGPSSLQSVAIPTELPGPYEYLSNTTKGLGMDSSGWGQRKMAGGCANGNECSWSTNTGRTTCFSGSTLLHRVRLVGRSVGQ